MSSPLAPDRWTLRNGTEVRLRPIRPDDEALMVRFHQGLSERTVFMRYFHLTSLDERVKHDRLARLCTVDPAIEAAIVAERDGEDGAPRIVGVGRLTRADGTGAAEIALLVADEMQGQGLGSELLRRLCDHARRIGVRRLVGEILAENDPMLAVARRTGFTIARVPGDAQVYRATLSLETP